MNLGVVSSLVLLMAMAVVASAQSSSGSTSASIFANSSDFNSSSSSSSSKTLCEICRDEGNCSKAYNGDAGQYCNTWVDFAQARHACCCPTTAECSIFSNYRSYGCNCVPKRSDSQSFWIWIGIGVVFIVIGLFIGRALLMAGCKRLRQERGDDNYPTGAGVVYAQQLVYIQDGNIQHGNAPVAYYIQPVNAQGGHGQPT